MRVVTYPPKMAPSALLPSTAKRIAAHVGFDCAPMSPAIAKGQTSTLQPNHAEPVSALGPELQSRSVNERTVRLTSTAPRRLFISATG